MGQLDHRVDHGARVGAVLHVLHEAAVDLQLLGRQLAQVGQARVAGAEVVDRQVHAQRRPGARKVACVAWVSSIAADLGDLAGQQRRVGSVARRAHPRCASTMSSWRICSADRLIATRMRRPCVAPGARPGGRRRRSPSRRCAPIRPKRSASGMNTPGGTMPRVGCCQRSSASAAVTWPLARRSSAGSTARARCARGPRRRSRAGRSCSRASASIAGEKKRGACRRRAWRRTSRRRRARSACSAGAVSG